MALIPRNKAKLIGARAPGQVPHEIPASAPRDAQGLLSVIGSEDRVQIMDTEQMPWRMICSLRMRSRTGSRFVGTGWFVGPRTVITAGHCLLDRTAGQMASIEVMPGRRHDHMPFGSIEVSHAATEVHPVWARDFDPNFDIGVIHLPRPLGDETGWFSFAVAENADLFSKQMNVGGYPFAVAGGAVSGKELWWHKDAVLDASERRLFYATDTSGGQSGSPVWAFEDADGAPIVVGIHAYGASLVKANATDGSLAEANSAPRIDGEIADMIEGWLAKDA